MPNIIIIICMAHARGLVLDIIHLLVIMTAMNAPINQAMHLILVHRQVILVHGNVMRGMNITVRPVNAAHVQIITGQKLGRIQKK